MSLSMWAWRVVFPGGGLVACLVVLWATVQPGGDPARGRGRAAARTEPAGRVVAEGRVVARPGAEVTVGTEAGGLVVEMPAREKVSVKKGDLLVRFRSADLEAAVAEAEARLTEADAEYEFQKREFRRRVLSPLDSKNYLSETDASRRDFEVAAARRRVAVAVLDRSKSALSQTRVTSPIDGVVLARLIDAGETAAPGARLVTVCDLSRTRVEAEVDEFDAQRVALGDAVSITSEGHGSASWAGTVEEVPDLVSGRSIRPADPGRPTDTGVLLVKVAPEGPLPLKLGQRVEVEIRPALLPPNVRKP